MLVRELAGIRQRPDDALMRCEVAEALNDWLENDVKPEAEAQLQSAITEIHHIAPNCRRIAGPHLSQHSFANAVDITAFRLKDGQRLTCLRDGTLLRLMFRRFGSASIGAHAVIFPYLWARLQLHTAITSILILAPCRHVAKEIHEADLATIVQA